MNALILAHRFLRWRAMGTLLAVLSVSLAVGLVVTLRTLPEALARGAAEPAVRLPFIVGRADSASRLVLAVVFLEQPAPRPLPWAALERLREKGSAWDAIPIDIEHGPTGSFVRTTRSYFHRAQERMMLAAGRHFDDHERRAAVVGSEIARRQGLRVGGRISEPGREDGLTVVGVLASTGTMVDQSVLLPFGDSAASVSAVALVPKAGFDPQLVRARLADFDADVVEVDRTIRQLVGLVAAVGEIVNWLSVAVAALALALVLATFYSSMRERTRDLATLRVVGARRGTLLLMLAFEAAFVGLVGGLLGLLVARLLLAIATDTLGSAGYAFTARVGVDGLRVMLVGALATLFAGAIVARGVYRMDPVNGLAGVHRPWSELFDLPTRRRLRRSFMIFFVFGVTFLPSAVYRPSPRSRMPNVESYRLFALLRRWEGRGQPPAEITRLDGQILEIEGYRYTPPGAGPAGGRWQSELVLVSEEHNRPVELFHEDEHRPGPDERIEVELEQPVEPSLYPVRVRGTFRLVRDGSRRGPYRLVHAHARVIASPDD